MDPTITPSNESILSAEDVHRDNLTAFRVGNKARFLLNRGLLALYETGLYRALDYPTIIKYADVNFGFSGSQTYESLRVAEALRTLPRLTEAFRDGKTFWSAVREITRIAKPRTEETWINWAIGKTCRQLCFPPSVPPRGSLAMRSRTPSGTSGICPGRTQVASPISSCASSSESRSKSGRSSKGPSPSSRRR
jgi:hypothetical protein